MTVEELRVGDRFRWFPREMQAQTVTDINWEWGTLVRVKYVHDDGVESYASVEFETPVYIEGMDD